MNIDKVGQQLVSFDSLGVRAVLAMLVKTVAEVLYRFVPCNKEILGIVVAVIICVFAASQTPSEARVGRAWIFLAIFNAFLVYSTAFGYETLGGAGRNT